MDRNHRIVLSPVEQDSTNRCPLHRAPRLIVVLGKERDDQVRLFVHRLQLQVTTVTEQLNLVPLIVKYAVTSQLYCECFGDLQDKVPMLAWKG